MKHATAAEKAKTITDSGPINRTGADGASGASGRQ